MRLAYSIDPVDLVAIAVVVLAYGFAFSAFVVVSKLRQRKMKAAHKKRLDQLYGKDLDQG